MRGDPHETDRFMGTISGTVIAEDREQHFGLKGANATWSKRPTV